MFALNLDTDGRILSATFPEYAPDDAAQVELLPEGNISDYLYKDGECIYDPLPEVEPPEPVPTLEERVTTVENDVTELTAAIERGLAL